MSIVIDLPDELLNCATTLYLKKKKNKLQPATHRGG